MQRSLGQILLLAVEERDEIGKLPAQRAGAVHGCIMNLPLRIARAVPPGAACLVAGAAVIVAPDVVNAEQRAVPSAPVSMIRLDPDLVCCGLRSHAGRPAPTPEARVHSALERAVQENREQPLEVTCRVQDDPHARVFKLRQSASTLGSGRRWELSMRDRETKDGWIQLALPGAVPAITRESAKLSYRNANGGRQVDLDVGPGASRLDVWVDYGLDVNIEPDLDPRVDRLNTHGPIAALACTIGTVEPD
jgi:hypothetical protein